MKTHDRFNEAQGLSTGEHSFRPFPVPKPVTTPITRLSDATLRECAAVRLRLKVPESALVETDKAHQFDVPTEAEIDEMARLDKLKRRPIGTPHEL